MKTVDPPFPKISYRKLLKILARKRTRAVVNPFLQREITEGPTVISVHAYTPEQLKYETPENILEYLQKNPEPGFIRWINMDHLHAEQMTAVCEHFGIHWLIQEDIISIGQRPKVDEYDGILFVLLNLIYYNEDIGLIEKEQISIVLGQDFVLSFQEDSRRDVFDPIRKKLQIAGSRERQRDEDFLFYSLIDVIADSYLQVIEQLGVQIEHIEEQMLQRSSPTHFQRISQLRKDIILLKRYITPVRDLVATIIRSNSTLLKKGTIRYFKDVHDHVALASDLVDNYRDMNMALQDMYVNSVNLRMNEVMKTLAIITAIMAPATVIGGLFGMNFKYIPFSDFRYGFHITIGIMIFIPFLMILWFYIRGWFHKEFPGKNNGSLF